MESDLKNYSFKEIKTLKCGENPHQKASLYSYDKELDYEIIQGKELSYNNILNLTAALEISAEFFDVSACVVVKHSNPISAALAKDIEGAFDKVLDSDPISPFASTMAFTRKVDISLAKKLSSIPIEVIIAPDYTNEALDELKKSSKLKIIKLNTLLQEILKFQDEEIKLTPFGALIQEKNTACLDVQTFKVITKKKPEQAELEDMIFAFKIVKHAKSSAIVVAKNLRTLGICAGQPDSPTAVEFAINKVCDSPKDSIIASDSVLLSIDNIHIAVQNRIAGIIQPGGSVKDKELIDSADKLGISMVTTGIRHLKH